MHSVYLFDFDYTLADATVGIIGSFNAALTQMGYPALDSDTICRTVGMTLPNAFTHVTGNTDPELAKNFTSLFMKKADDIMSPGTNLLPGCVELLTFLKNRGFKTGIVSSKPRFRIAELLRLRQIEHLIDVVVGYEDVTNHKPHPEALQAALKRLHATEKDTLYVGDTVIDAEAARNAGIAFAAVTTGTTTKEDFAPFADIVVYNDLTDLLGALRS
ncbi:MAG TPA: HAD family hydrolase [Papillibacter sp.]|jgi:phosphoglycolate phosphatase|nr:HAD family hydrolase [Papillibacter sp.]